MPTAPRPRRGGPPCSTPGPSRRATNPPRSWTGPDHPGPRGRQRDRPGRGRIDETPAELDRVGDRRFTGAPCRPADPPPGRSRRTFATRRLDGGSPMTATSPITMASSPIRSSTRSREPAQRLSESGNKATITAATARSSRAATVSRPRERHPTRRRAADVIDQLVDRPVTRKNTVTPPSCGTPDRRRSVSRNRHTSTRPTLTVWTHTTTPSTTHGHTRAWADPDAVHEGRTWTTSDGRHSAAEIGPRQQCYEHGRHWLRARSTRRLAVERSAPILAFPLWCPELSLALRPPA